MPAMVKFTRYALAPLFRSERRLYGVVVTAMPGLDGCGTARRIRASEEDRPLLLIVLTGWGQEEDRRRTTEAGFNYHLVKPLNFADLQEVLHRSHSSSRASNSCS